MILDKTPNSHQQILGLFSYKSSAVGDAIGDTRFSNQSGIMKWEYCTVANDAKEGGTWVVYASINAIGKQKHVVQTTVTTYVSGTGTAGTDNTAMTVLARTLAANIMAELGDRVRIRGYFQATGGAPCVGTIKLNTVEVASISVVSTNFQAIECWLHYIDATHANIIEQHPDGLGALSAANVAGFTWTAAQSLIFTQDAVPGQHLTIYFLAVDFFPKGII